MTDRPPQLDDIQGNILAGFNTDVQVFIALTGHEDRFPDAAKWLASQAAAATTVAEVRSARDLMKQAKADLSVTWLCLAVGYRLLKATQPDVLIRDDAFNGGMERRAPSALGDKTNPANWRIGRTDSPVDVLLIVAANNAAAATARADELSASAAQAGLSASYRETANRLNDHEHFGFRDGISQPKVTGYDPEGDIGTGNFVFGYPKQAGADPFSPVVDPRGLTDNGSLLVIRRLAQDVRALRSFCTEEASRLSGQWPGLTPEHLGALLVGRWPSGAPVKTSQVADPGGSPPDNSFDFQDDYHAKACPFGAHIRKVNPRKGPKDVVNVPRMLRRGIPFGPKFDAAPDAERGLIFVAFQTSIKSQFEFITRNWMNSAVNPAPGQDLLVGRSETGRSLTIVGPQGPITVSDGGRQWVAPTGGAYLFVPSRSGLAKFGTPPAPLGWWRAQQLWAIASDRLKASFSGE